MAKDKTKRRGSAGTFFFGSFIGFLLCLILIVGSLCLIYFKVSANTINKMFKTDIDLKGANDKTLSDIVPSVLGLVQSTDTYTINNLKEDFGIEIKDKLFGIDITDLKNVAIDDLGEEVEKKFANISADELRNVNGMGLEDMKHILNQTNTYYYNSIANANNEIGLYKTYKDNKYSNKVTFDYVVSGQDIITKGHSSPIISGEVKIPLWYLPLTDALGDFTKNMGENITLYDLDQSYGVKLPSFIKLTEQEMQDTTINELESVINDVKVKDILDLNIKSYKETKDGPTIYYNDRDNNGLRDSSKEEVVTYVLYSISEKQIDELSKTINEFKLSQVFSPDQRTNGILSLITTDPTIEQIPSEIEKVIKNTTLAELISKGVIEKPADYDDLDDHVTTVADAVNGGFKTVAELTLPELIDYCLDLIELSKSVTT